MFNLASCVPVNICGSYLLIDADDVPLSQIKFFSFLFSSIHFFLLFSSYLSTCYLTTYLPPLHLLYFLDSVHSGSCTMKLNATVEMQPVTWPETCNMHPFAPADQTMGYKEMIDSLNRDLAEITGFAAVSAQPNSGAQVRSNIIINLLH